MSKETPQKTTSGLLDLIAARMELMAMLHNQRHELRGVCWNCHKHLSKMEVWKGFGDNPEDYTVPCPKCHARVEPKLQESFAGGGKGEMPFFGVAQILYRLVGKEHLSPDALIKKHAPAYRSAMIRFGGIGAAFKKMGVVYQGGPIVGWEEKVDRFLGWLPPAVIAAAANVTTIEVEALCFTRGVVYESSSALMSKWKSSRDGVEKTPDRRMRLTQRLDRISPDHESYAGPTHLDKMQHPVSKRTHEGVGVAGCFVAKVAPTLGA
jgi:hypothetical protein